MTYQRNDFDFDGVVERARREILRDIEAGRVPAGVRSFSQLHDFVDANEYGGGFDWPEEEWGTDEFCSFWNRVQNHLDAWLASGRESPC